MLDTKPPWEDGRATDWRITLVQSEDIARATRAFHFIKPARLEFTAGQFADLTLISPPEMDDQGPSRTLTIASAPFEDELMFAVRMRDSAFRRDLKGLRPGGQILMDHPTGTFTLHRDRTKASVFIAGGIGIAPFLSIIRQTSHEGTPRKIYLFYSNRRPEDAPFLAELQELAGDNPYFQFIPTMTQVSTSQHQWTGETNYLRKDTIAKYVGELIGPLYYIAGPPAMVESMRQKLRDAKVKPDDIFTDEFIGY